MPFDVKLLNSFNFSKKNLFQVDLSDSENDWGSDEEGGGGGKVSISPTIY